MRARITAAVLSLITLGAVFAPGGSPAAWADRPTVSVVRFGADEGRTRVVVEADAPISYGYFTLAERSRRLVVDLEPVRWAIRGEDGSTRGEASGAGTGDGLVAGYRYAHNSSSASRLVFDLAAPVRVSRDFVLPPAAGAPRHRLVLDLVPTSAAQFAQSAGAPQARERARTRSAPADAPIRRSARFVVVIDPGHGGRDPGAIGPGGLQEKDVNLAVARLLRDRLERSRRYEVVMTRDEDRFVELADRVDFAREAGADLFISLHADSSASGSSVRGASVYTLATRAERRARTDILSRQNWLIDVELEGRDPQISDILVDLAQRDTHNQSDAFAEMLIPQLDAVGPVLRNTHRNAGLYVLLAPDVPAVLVEMGFLSNPQDEALLSSNRHRQRLAAALERAIDRYYNERARLVATR